MIANHYVSNKQLFIDIVAYQKSVRKAGRDKQPVPQITEPIGRAILLICSKLLDRPNFASYSYRDEMCSDAVENCVAAIMKFNSNKSRNPFAYLTQISWNASVRRLHKEKRQVYIKEKSIEYLGLLDELQAVADDSKSRTGGGRDDRRDNFVEDFEKKVLKKRRKNVKIKPGLRKFIED